MYNYIKHMYIHELGRVVTSNSFQFCAIIISILREKRRVVSYGTNIFLREQLFI